MNLSQISHEHQKMIIKGALFSLNTPKSIKRTEILRNVATLIMLEDNIGDKQFSFLLATSLPESCGLIQQQETTVNMYDNVAAKRTMELIRTQFYVTGIRNQTKSLFDKKFRK